MAIPDTVTESKPRLTEQVAQFFPEPGQWSETEYFSLPDSNHIVELSEGELVMPPPPDFSHQTSSFHLVRALDRFIEKNDLGILRYAPLAIRLWHGKIREPDIMFFLKAHQDRIGERVSGVPDLAIEILSPATHKTDRNDKFSEYANAGVTEYWIVDPKERTVEVYALQEGANLLFGKFVKDEIVKSKRLDGFEIAAAKVF